jgi:hypothetical protein
MSTTLLLAGPPVAFVLIGEIVRLLLRRIAVEPTSLQSRGSDIDRPWSAEAAAGRSPVRENATV